MADSEVEINACRAVSDEMERRFDMLHRFVDRRIAELSADVHGATKLFDYSEANLSAQIANIQQHVMSIVAAPSAASVNSGIELEAIVKATEEAANKIMEATEAIDDWVRDGVRDEASMKAAALHINAIFEACSFQDLTSQRVRRAITQMKHVDLLLTDLRRPSPKAVPPSVDGSVPRVEASGPDLAQADIDQLLYDR